MDSSMCSSAPDPEMWIIQGTLACYASFYSLAGSGRSGGPPRLLSSRASIHPFSVYGQLSFEHRLRFGLNGENGSPNNASSQKKNYEITLFNQEIGSSHIRREECLV
ncbi:hypothetical protein AMTRI_Chr04g181140 [Amborella trichopoda]